ncbi:DMT family transporter [Granulosicoccus sp.]|nr:DMT family transporter [Granulosicoccus sp.]MDB4223036.1 DMT family transporter [Granulosicoccus sp.]
MREPATPLLSRLEARTQSVTWGIFFMVSGTMIIPAMDAIAKILGDTISPLQVTWGRFFFQALIMGITIIALYGLRPGIRLLRPKRPIVHAARGVLLAIATTFFFFSLLYLPLADSIAIFFVQPMLLTLLSAIFLGETIGWHRRAAVVIGFLGAMLIIKPGSESFTLAALLPIAAALFFSGYLVVTRSVANVDHPMTMQFASGASASVVLSVALLPGTFSDSAMWGARVPSTIEWAYLIAIGVIAAFGHLLVVIAVNRAPTSVLAPFGYVEIIAATILGWLIFSEWPDTLSWLGITIIIFSGLYVFVREQHVAMNKST